MNLPEILGRLILIAVGAVLVHDAARWRHSWLYKGRGFYPGRWIRAQSDAAQLIWRISVGLIGGLLVLASLFGSVSR